MQINLPRDVSFILQKLRLAGHEAFAVGGCVRDSLMSLVPKDWDIATSMFPRDVESLFPRTFATGLSHGTVTVVMNRVNYEVTTYRLDGEYFDARRPSSVTFTRSIEEDLSRRDFTINAMAYNEERGLVDLFGGMNDLNSKFIRAVGDPVQRFTEDALRMLRAVRFAAQLGFEIETETFRAAFDLKERLSLISAERVREELVKLLLSPNPEYGELLENLGMLPLALRGKSYDGDLRKALGWVSKCPGHIPMRMALFFYWAGEDVEPLMRSLRFDNKTTGETLAYIRGFNRKLDTERHLIKKELADIPADWFFNLLTLKEIIADSSLERLHSSLSAVRGSAEDIIARNECVRVADLKINGNDLIESGVPKGRQVGETLELLLREVHKEPELNEKDKLLRLAQNIRAIT